MTNDAWSAHDLEMIGHREVFLQKPGILKRAEARLRDLESALARELKDTAPALPPDSKVDKGQLARGENHKGFPFLSLDIPQSFSKTEYFTFRTLFWWGHYLGFSLILKGGGQNLWLENLLKLRQTENWQDVCLSTAKTPFEWDVELLKRAQDMPEEDIRTTVGTLEYVKLIRIYPVQDESFVSLDWTAAGLAAWRDLSKAALD